MGAALNAALIAGDVASVACVQRCRWGRAAGKAAPRQGEHGGSPREGGGGGGCPWWGSDFNCGRTLVHNEGGAVEYSGLSGLGWGRALDPLLHKLAMNWNQSKRAGDLNRVKQICW